MPASRNSSPGIPLPVYNVGSVAVPPPGGYSVISAPPGSVEAVQLITYQQPVVVETVDVEQLVADTTRSEKPKVSWLRELLLCTTCLTFIVLVVVGLALLVYRNSKVVCHTPACNEYSRLLRETISDTVDPCQNFYQFVCEGYDKKHDHSVKDEHRSYHLGVMESYAALLDVTSRDQTTQEKAAKFYQSCIAVYLKNGTEGGNFLRLLKELNFSWPQQPRRPDLLDAMASYSTRLGVGPLLVLTKANAVNGTVVRVAPGTFPSQWLGVRQKLMSKNKYRDYFGRAYEIVKGTKPDPTAFPSHKNFEDAILSYLTGREDDFGVVQVSLDEFNALGRAFSLARWKETFSQLLDVAENATMTVKLTNPSYFGAFNRVTSKVSEAVMVYFLEWAVLFQLGHLFFRDLADFCYDTPSEAKEASCHRCYQHVDRHMSCALSHSYFTNAVPYESYAFVKDMALEIQHQTAMRLGQLGSIAFDYARFHSQQDASYMFKFYDMHSSYLVLLSSVYPDMEASFLENHLGVVAARRRWDHSDLFDYSCADGRDVYNFHDDEVEATAIPPVALILPIFSLNATVALQYGTLGTLIARSVMRGIYVSARPNMTLQDRDAFGVVEDCIVGTANASRDSVSEEAVYEASAATIAWRSFQNADDVSRQRRSEWLSQRVLQVFGEQDRLLPGLTRFGPDRMFFVSACYVHCAGSKGKYDGTCNAFVRNSRQFSEAFGCPLASAMNPVRKCGL